MRHTRRHLPSATSRAPTFHSHSAVFTSPQATTRRGRSHCVHHSSVDTVPKIRKSTSHHKQGCSEGVPTKRPTKSTNRLTDRPLTDRPPNRPPVSPSADAPLPRACCGSRIVYSFCRVRPRACTGCFLGAPHALPIAPLLPNDQATRQATREAACGCAMDPGWHHGRREGTCGFQDKRSQPSDAIGTCTPHEGALFALASDRLVGQCCRGPQPPAILVGPV